MFHEQRSGAPIKTTREDNMTKVHGLVSANHRLKLCEIADVVETS